MEETSRKGEAPMRRMWAASNGARVVSFVEANDNAGEEPVPMPDFVRDFVARELAPRVPAAPSARYDWQRFHGGAPRAVVHVDELRRALVEQPVPEAGRPSTVEAPAGVALRPEPEAANADGARQGAVAGVRRHEGKRSAGGAP